MTRATAIITTACILAGILQTTAATTNKVGHVVLIDAATGDTKPAQSIATPGQVQSATTAASNTLDTATALETTASTAAALAQAAYARTTLYSTNYVVTSTVYVQSIGGVPYDPSNQTMRVHSIAADAENIVITSTVSQEPLVTPTLDFRQSLNGDAWSNITATVQEVAVPEGATNAVKAYQFTLDRPTGASAFFRVVDNSTGASGSGLYWLVFGAIYVDGQKGWTGIFTTPDEGNTRTNRVVGGIIVEATPL